MGMDLEGVMPKSEKGAYFRNNCWWWRPLWDFVADNCSCVTEGDREKGHYNDGHEIDGEKAEQIADQLFTYLDSGMVKAFKKSRDLKLKGMANVKCEICHGLGHREDKYVTGKCNGCDGTGERRPWECSYPFDTENVREFAEFCRESGGFRIY